MFNYITILAVSASIFYAIQVVSVGYGMENYRKKFQGTITYPAAFISILISVIIFWIALWISGFQFQRLITESRNLIPFIIAGVLNPGIFQIIYYEGIDRIGPSINSAIVAANPAIATIIAIQLLGENPTIFIITGMLMIVFGVIIIQLTRKSASEQYDSINTKNKATFYHPLSEEYQRKEKLKKMDKIARDLANTKLKDFIYPIISMILLGSSYVIIKYGLTDFPNSFVATSIAQTSALIVFVIITLAYNGAKKENFYVKNKKTLTAFIIAGAFVAFGWLTSFTALKYGQSIIVIPLANIFPLFALLISYGISKEIPKSPKILSAIIIILIGTIIIQIT